MSEAGDPLDFLPAAILADVLGRVADAGDIASCRLASRALLAASYHCPRVRLCAAARARRRRESGAGGPAFRAAAGNLASLLELHLRSLALDASEGQGYPDDAMWVEDGEVDEADDLHLTAGESIAAWAATAAGSSLREVEIADFWPQSCWRKAEALPVISQFLFDCCFSTDVMGEDEYRDYLSGIVAQLQDYFPDASFMVSNFWSADKRSRISDILSDMTVMDYPRLLVIVF